MLAHAAQPNRSRPNRPSPVERLARLAKPTIARPNRPKMTAAWRGGVVVGGRRVGRGRFTARKGRGGRRRSDAHDARSGCLHTGGMKRLLLLVGRVYCECPTRRGMTDQNTSKLCALNYKFFIIIAEIVAFPNACVCTYTRGIYFKRGHLHIFQK